MYKKRNIWPSFTFLLPANVSYFSSLVGRSVSQWVNWSVAIILSYMLPLLELILVISSLSTYSLTTSKWKIITIKWLAPLLPVQEIQVQISDQSMSVLTDLSWLSSVPPGMLGLYLKFGHDLHLIHVIQSPFDATDK